MRKLIKVIYSIKILFTGVFILLNYTAFSGPDNIAPLANVSAPAELNNSFSVKNVVDGVIGVDELGEWASDTKVNFWGGVNYPWIQLDWKKEYLIDKIVFYDRVSLHSHLGGGTLQFSDGSQISVNLIPNDGSARVIEFPAKNIKWIRFVVTDGDGDNIGLSEIEVFPSTTGDLDPVSMVDPYIETTRGRYFFFVTGSLPFGMISSAPLTRNKNQMGGGYN